MRRSVLWLVLSLLMLSLSAAAAIPNNFFGLTYHQDQNYPSVPFGSTRTWDAWTMAWSEIETSPGVYNWSALDSRVALSAQHNQDVLYTFGRTPSWAISGSCSGLYAPNGCAQPPANLQYWDDFVTAIAQRYAGKIKYWELWNEPNDTTGYWTGGIPTMATMAQHAYNIIKATDPNAIVVTPAPTGGNTYGSSWMQQYLAAGGGSYADVIAFHGYWDTNPENIVTLINNYRQVMATYGQQNKPLWDTEASWGQTSAFSNQDAQAAFLARYYILHMSGGVARFYWYAWDNSAWGTLWDATTGMHQPAIAYGEVYNWLVGATLATPCTSDSSGTWSCGITTATGASELIVWSPNTTATFYANLPLNRYRDLAGGDYALPANGAVTIGPKPILLYSASTVAPLAVTVTTPLTGSSVSTSMRVVASATSGNPVSAMKIYVDDVDSYTVYASSLDTYLAVAAGSHHVVVQAWDSTGAVAGQSLYVTAVAPSSSPCVLSTANQSVTICTPTAQSTVGSPVHVVAGTTDTTAPVTAVRIYVDNVSRYTVNAATVDTYVALASGKHRLVVQAWDSSGAVFKSGFQITVR